MPAITAPFGGRYAITATTTGTPLYDLLIAAGMPAGDWTTMGSGACGIRIAGQVVGGSDRAAVIIASPRRSSTPETFYAALVASDFTTHGEYIPAGQEYYNPFDTDVYSGIKAVAGTVVCTVTLYMK